jgi:DNA polymerase II large subunit
MEEEDEDDFLDFDSSMDIVELLNQGTRFVANDRGVTEWLRVVKSRTAQSMKQTVPRKETEGRRKVVGDEKPGL